MQPARVPAAACAVPGFEPVHPLKDISLLRKITRFRHGV
jgi:hypothetical protein